ncbi:MAG: type II secretion system protein [Ruminiclostridium sp.]|nr:type II secretion system protein [Ruminiclostridium sp.]
MKNFFNRLKGRKGFTLVECIVAIAVFAAMTMIVFMILTNARNEAVRANDTEEDLSQLIENVISDEVFKSYDATDYTQLSLKIQDASGSDTGKTFDITYETTDGYKNFVICPTCNHFSNNTEFMDGVLPEAFDQTSAYTCPADSSHIFYQTLECQDCLTTGLHNDTSKFRYLPSTGGYLCLTCSRTAVKGDNIEQRVVDDALMSINGFYPNAILYAPIPTPPSDVARFENGAGLSVTGGAFSMTLSYDAATDYYTLRIQVTSVPSMLNGSTGYLTFLFPQNYMFNDFKVPMGGGTSNPVVYENGTNTNPGHIKIGYNGSATTEITFQLVDSTSRKPFEDIYSSDDPNKQGLAEYWFQIPIGNTAEYETTGSYNATGNKTA